MKKILTLLFLIYSAFGFCQDAHFSQYNNSRLCTNPAFTGSDSTFVISNNARLQWPKLSPGYRSIALSADKYFRKIRGGLGLNILNDNEFGIISSSRLELNYAPHFELFHHFLVIQPGFQIAYDQRSIDWSQVTFGDMIDPRQGFVYSSTDVPGQSKKAFIDLSAGLLVYTKFFWTGIAVHHLTQPDEGFVYSEPLPVKLTLHGGAQIKFGKDLILSPTLLYMQQQDFNMFLPGLLAKYKFISLGISYRDQDAMIATLAFQNKFFRIGYSYDYTISTLTNASSGGSHELGMNFFPPKKRKNFSGAKLKDVIAIANACFIENWV